METLRAGRRLLFIALSVIILTSMCIFVLRTIGLSQVPVLAIDSSLRNNSLSFVTGENTAQPVFSANAYRHQLLAAPDAIVVVPVRPTRDQQWVVMGSEPLEKYSEGKGYVETQTLTEIKLLRSSAPFLSLNEFLTEFSPKRMLIIVHSREITAAPSLLTVLGDRPEPLLTMVSCQNNHLWREIRKQRPRWLYSATPTSLAQGQVFAALFLEPLAQLQFDWIFARDEKNLHPRLVTELRRRDVPSISF